MDTFRLPLALLERKDPNIAAHEDNALRIWAFSPWRTTWQLACAFLDDGYDRRKYQMQGLYDNLDGTLKVKFINFWDARLLYGQAFHYGCEMVVFNGANIFINYWDRFPNNGNFIHSVLLELPMAQDMPPPYPKVPMSQEPALSLELSLVPMPNKLPVAGWTRC